MKLYKSPVVFEAEAHTYTLGEKSLKGITGTLIMRAFPDKYKGVDDAVLANAARKGKELHEAIQNYDRFGLVFDDRIDNYQNIKNDYGLTTIENEYLVSDEENYASKVDIVMENKSEEICLVDTKTTWNLDKASVALQLSIYKRFFEKQNEGLKVSHLYALWLPNKNHTLSKLVEVAPVTDEVIDALIAADLNDEPFSYVSIPDGYGELEALYRHYAKMKQEAEQGIKQVNEKLMALMQEQKLTTIKSGNYTVSYIAESVKPRFDSTLFKSENKELYAKYMKDSVTAAYLRFTETKK